MSAKKSTKVPAVNKGPADATHDEKKPNPVLLYNQLAGLRKIMSAAANKQGSYGDLILSSTGYPSLLLSALLAKQSPQLAGHLGKLSSAISDYRMFWRVYNTPATVQWALDLLIDNPNKDIYLRIADYVQAIAGVLYQVLEDVAYLAMKGVLPIPDALQNDLWVVSSAFWATHVIVELIKIPYLQAKGKPWTALNLVTNLAWAPLTVHWSTYSGLLEKEYVGLFGSLATVPRLYFALNN